MKKMVEIHDLLKIANQAALLAGKAILDIYTSGNFLSTLKEDESPVTLADKKSHVIICDHLRQTNLPVLSEEGSLVIYDTRKGWDYFWLIDPLDGTKEFINKNGEFTINIALVHKNKPIAGVVFIPYKNVMYAGSTETGAYKTENGAVTCFKSLPERKRFDDLRGKEKLRIVASRSHLSPETKKFIEQFPGAGLKISGSSVKFMMLLENEADIYPRLEPTMEWDTAAAHAILNAANRGVYQTDLLSELSYNKPDLHNPFFIAF